MEEPDEFLEQRLGLDQQAHQLGRLVGRYAARDGHQEFSTRNTVNDV
jgi:hypothetical protein